MSECVFCSIIAGDLPSYVVHEDKTAIAFLDIAPIRRGHTLVVPRRHVADVMSEGANEALCDVANAIHESGSLLMKAFDADGLSVFQANGAAAGQEVWHLHFHLIPVRKDEPPFVQVHRNIGEAGRLVETLAFINSKAKAH